MIEQKYKVKVCDRCGLRLPCLKNIFTDKPDMWLCNRCMEKPDPKITEHEKELEELERIIDHTNLYPKYLERGYCTDGSEEAIWDERNQKIARIIQQAGYTKKHFPIEKLEAWLREKDYYEKASGELKGYRKYLHVLDKIAELKEG